MPDKNRCTLLPGYKLHFVSILLLGLASIQDSSSTLSPSQVRGNLDHAPPAFSIAVVIDISNSLNGQGNQKKIEVVLNEFTHLIKESNLKNEYFIIAFSTQPYLVLNGGSDLNTTLGAISQVGTIPKGGATALYDACILGTTKAIQGHHSRKAVFVFSDGIDTISEKTLDHLEELLKGQNIPVYAVNFSDPQNTTNKSSKLGIKILDKVASISGGLSFHPQKLQELKAAFETIKAKMNSTQ